MHFVWAESREHSERAQQLSSSLRSVLRWLTHTHAVKIILSFLWLCVTTYLHIWDRERRVSASLSLLSLLSSVQYPRTVLARWWTRWGCWLIVMEHPELGWVARLAIDLAWNSALTPLTPRLNDVGGRSEKKHVKDSRISTSTPISWSASTSYGALAGWCQHKTVAARSG